MGADARGELVAPMPGRVIAVLVETGARVQPGAPLVVMEAMKMEHTVTAQPRERWPTSTWPSATRCAKGPSCCGWSEAAQPCAAIAGMLRARNRAVNLPEIP